MADVMRMRRLIMLKTSVRVKIQLNLQECSWDSIYKGNIMAPSKS